MKIIANGTVERNTRRRRRRGEGASTQAEPEAVVMIGAYKSLRRVHQGR